MVNMTRAACCMLFTLTWTAAAAPSIDPAEVMAKVAANMESGAAARRQYVYQQRVKANITQSNGKVNRREERIYSVVPHEKSTEKQLVSIKGEYRSGKNMVTYTELQSRRNATEQDDDNGKGKEGVAEGIDGAIIDNLIDDLVNDKKSPDGIPHNLFPLRTGDLPAYQFKYLGEREFQGRRVMRIAFEPADKRKDLCVHVGKDGEDEEDEHACHTPWAGEAWIDAQELFPVRIDTKLARGIPAAVKILLGTNIRQLGFSVTYARAGENAWFPATYGTEFKLNVLFFYKRTISLSLESSDFRRVDTSSNIEFEQVSENTKQ